MRQTKDYRVIEASPGSASLVEQVKDAIKLGWEPLGGIGSVIDNRGPVAMQAMVKYQEPAPTKSELADMDQNKVTASLKELAAERRAQALDPVRNQPASNPPRELPPFF